MTRLSESNSFLIKEESQRRSLRFAGPRATSQWVVLPILVFLSFNVTVVGFTQVTVDQLILLRVTFFALVSAWLYFTVLGTILNRIFARFGTGRNWAIGFLYATTELIRTCLIHLYSVSAGIPSTADWSFRITGGLTTGIVMFSIVSTALNDGASYTSAYRKLITQQLKLQATIAASQENLLRTRDQIVESARLQISQALFSTRDESEKINPSYSRIIDELFRVTEEIVRPLSHSLFDNPVGFVSPEQQMKPPKVPLKRFLSDSSTAAPFRPGTMILIASMLSFPSLFLVQSWFYALAWSLCLLFFYVFIAIAAKFITPVLIKIPYVVRLLLIAVIFIIPAVIFTFVVFFALFDGPELSWNVVLYGSILGLGVGALVASSQGMLASRARMLQEVSDINDELYWLNVRLQAELWLDQKNLALTLHNDVQATLLAAALKLKASWGEGKTSADTVMPEVKELIYRSINFATAAPDQRSLADAIARINDNWAGLITMKFTATAETQELVQSDPVTMGVLEDVLSEFQNNSLKHGQATETTAILTSPAAGVLQVAMSNNGHRIDTAVEGGLGSHFLASVSLSYKLENFDRGVRLTVKLPISAHPQ